MRRVILLTLIFFALLFGVVLYYHNAPFLFEGIHRGFLLTKESHVLHTSYLPAFYVHIITGSLVLVAGVFQLSKKIRSSYPKWHRRSGKFYVAIILIPCCILVVLHLERLDERAQTRLDQTPRIYASELRSHVRGCDIKNVFVYVCIGRI
jgi:hypothetical protein